jgi:hypothetical protein
MSLSSVSRNSSLRKQQEPGGTPVETPEITQEATSTSIDGQVGQRLLRETMDVAELAARLDEYLSRQELTAKEFSARHKLNPRDVSLVRNHSRRVAAGKQVAPPGAVRRLAEILGTCNWHKDGNMMDGGVITAEDFEQRKKLLLAAGAAS